MENAVTHLKWTKLQVRLFVKREKKERVAADQIVIGAIGMRHI